MRFLTLLVLTVAVLFGQSDSPNVTLSPGPPVIGYTTILHYSGTTVDYTCTARSTQEIVKTVTISTVSNANPGSMTATSHGFYYASGVTQKILVFISGATGGWAPINGLHILTPTSANALALDVDTTAYGAWGSQVVVVSTRAPKATDTVWTVKSFVYDGSGNLTITANAVRKAPGNGTTIQDLSGGSTQRQFACAAPASYQ